MTMPDFGQLKDQLSRLGNEMERARADLEMNDVHGASPDGMVRATMRAGRLDALFIDPAAMEQDPVRLANQVVAAVQDCHARSTEMLTRRMSPMTDEMRQTMRDLG
jgi:DNA-binding protein YbaB